MSRRIEAAVETGAKRVFVTAVDWPGWSRSGRTEEAALDAFVACAPRYAAVAAAAAEAFPDVPGVENIDIVERNPGDGGTDFGVPGRVTEHDRRPVSPAEADRLRRLVAGAWVVFDQVAAGAPAELRKGPRGGGRDRDKLIDHVHGADHAYCGVMGIRVPGPSGDDPASIAVRRSAVLDLLGQPSDGTPLGGRKWPPRYAAGRIAWHALDHAWEIEDRTEAGQAS
ncbi:MAG: hypothetical protein HY262_12635 [Chloroflexi bacterium]|nr:hypothetical protein [Chloroflexota bacterium]